MNLPGVIAVMDGSDHVPLKNIIIIILVTFMTLSWIAFIDAEEKNITEKRLVGGSCEYKSYSGSATIVSIQESVPTSEAKDKYYEILFSFQTDQLIDESFVRTEKKNYSLLDKNTLPDQTFVTRHGITVNRVFPCVMKVIVRGTCTPVMFEFPTFQRSER